MYSHLSRLSVWIVVLLWLLSPTSSRAIRCKGHSVRTTSLLRDWPRIFMPCFAAHKSHRAVYLWLSGQPSCLTVALGCLTVSLSLSDMAWNTHRLIIHFPPFPYRYRLWEAGCWGHKHPPPASAKPFEPYLLILFAVGCLTVALFSQEN